MSIIPFDDRDGQIWFDGGLRPWRDAKIHVLTHALHYASCVFEGERVYGGKIFKLREHSQRLIDSGRILGFEIPLSVEEIDAATNAVVRANNIKDGYVRPLAWRGAEQMGVAAQLTNANLERATFAGADCSGGSFHGANLARARFDGATAVRALFTSARLAGASFAHSLEALREAHGALAELFG